MNLTKIGCAAGVGYLLNTIVAGGDGLAPGSGAVAYFNAPGTPPGIWMGSATAALGVREGSRANASHARLVFEKFAHPTLATPLGQPPQQLHTTGASGGDQVSGFDLTFRVPKSVSVLWGVADEGLQKQIMGIHHEAIAGTLKWFEDEVAVTRSGRGGVASTAVRGVFGIAYDHFETRDGDPHLHTHFALANRVQRASDGKWMTLDGRAIYASAVLMSELHENLLLDLLRDRLGMEFTERDRGPVTSRAVVLDIAGVPKDLITKFSSRDQAVTRATNELVAKYVAEHGHKPDVRTFNRLKAHAWAATRAPKPDLAQPLPELTSRWRAMLEDLGTNHHELTVAAVGRTPARAAITIDAATGRPELIGSLARLVIESWRAAGGGEAEALVNLTDEQAVEVYLEDRDDDAVIDDVATHITTVLTRSKATWKRSNAAAEAHRITRHIPCKPGVRQVFVDAITDAALEQCVRVTPAVFNLPEQAASDARLAYGAGRSRPTAATVFDDPNLTIYTSQEVLDAEAYCQSLTETPTTAIVYADVAEDMLTGYLTDSGHPLAPDQLAGAMHLATSPGVMAAMIGPAGSGKTTTMKALREVWTHHHGTASVMGVAHSRVAATKLGESIGIETHTIAMLLAKNTPEAIARREARRAELASELARARTWRARTAVMRAIAAVDADEYASTIRPGTLLIVDETSMADTHAIAALGRLAQDAGAKIALVGDPAQLDAIGAGGMLGWLDRQGKAAHLTSLFRFKSTLHYESNGEEIHLPEAKATLRLRKGDASVLEAYDGAGRIHSGDSDAMLDAAYEATLAALEQGRDALLIAATNEHVETLNMRFTTDRRLAGHVSLDALVPLRGNQDAGVGDLILARKNDYKDLRDASGAPLYNGALLRVEEIRADGSALCRRTTTGTELGATVTLPAAYLRDECELGYAITAHRAQGADVDDGIVYIPYSPTASLTRELFYVAMTRGRESNHVYVGLPDQTERAHEGIASYTVTPGGVPVKVEVTAHQVLAKILAAEGAERTAHETIEAETEARAHLGYLTATHDYLASHAVREPLLAYLTHHHGEHTAAAVKDSPAFDALLTAFRKAHAVNPDRALSLLRIPLARPAAAQGALDVDGEVVTDVHQLRDAVEAAERALIRVDEPEGIAYDLERAKAALNTARARYEKAATAVDDGLELRDSTGAPITADLTAAQAAINDAARHVAKLDAASTPGPARDKRRAAAKERLAEARAQLAAAAPDPAAIAHHRLSAALLDPQAPLVGDPGYIGGLVVPITTDDPALASLAARAEHLLRRRIEHLTEQIDDGTLPWLAATLPAPSSPLDPEGDPARYARWRDAVLTAAIYRDRWQIDPGAPAPAGPEPAKSENRSKIAHYNHVRRALATWEDPNPTRLNLSAPPAPDPHADVDWQALDPGETYTQPGPGWTPADTEYPSVPASQEPAPEDDPWAFDPTLDTAFLPRPAALSADEVRADEEWLGKDTSTLDRIDAANRAAYTFWQHHATATGSWVPTYLDQRALTGAVTPAHAPPGWTTTIEHLRREGFTDAEILDAGLAGVSEKTGGMYDRFRDRLPLPVYDQAGRMAGFTARANPAADDPRAPKYLNTPETQAYKKSELLYGLTPSAAGKLREGATPVLVEGAFDAEAINIAARQHGLDVVGLAPCGTATTTAQLNLIATNSPTPPVVAFDQDTAGTKAAGKVFPLLDPSRAGQARQAVWDAGVAKDPGELVETGRSTVLAAALTVPVPLGRAHAVTQIAEMNDAVARQPRQARLYAYTPSGRAKQIAVDAAATADLETIAAVRDVLVERLTGEHGPLDDAAIDRLLPATTAASHTTAPTTFDDPLLTPQAPNFDVGL